MADFFNTLDRPVLAITDPADQNYVGWTHDPVSNVNQSTHSSGVLYGSRVMIRNPASVTSVTLFCSTGGLTLTSGQNFVGVYDSAGVQVGTSADQTTAWGTTGEKAAALVGGPFTVSGPFVWVVLVVNGLTPPRFGVASLFSVGTNAGLAAAETRFASQSSGHTVLPASVTPGSWLQDANAPWAALA